MKHTLDCAGNCGEKIIRAIWVKSAHCFSCRKLNKKLTHIKNKEAKKHGRVA